MTETPLPSSVEYRLITGTFIQGYQDAVDPDKLPGGGGMTGTVVFTPELDPAVPYLLNTQGYHIYPPKFTVNLDGNGQMVDQGTVGVSLVVTEDVDNNPASWQYRVEYRFVGQPVTTYHINVSPGAAPLDLYSVARVPGSAGVGVTRGASAYEVAVAAGYVGTVAQWLASLEGADGTGGTTDLSSTRTANDVTIATSTGGQPVTLTSATTIRAGVITSADFNLLRAASPIQVFTVATQAAQLALVAKQGDHAKRTDISKTYIDNGGTSGTMTDWTEISGTGAVSSVNALTGAVVLTKSSVGLGAVDNTADTAKPVSTAQATALGLKADTADIAAIGFSGSASDLTGGMVPTSMLPATVINNTYTVASQAAMLALAAVKGDLARRTDISKTFSLATNSPSVLADWKELLGSGTAPPEDPIPTVAGSRTLGTGAQQALPGDHFSVTNTREPINGSVDTIKLVNLAVTNAKIGDGAVGPAKIADAAVTLAKTNVGGTPTTAKVVGYDGTTWSWVTAATGGGTTDLALGTRTATTVPVTSSTGTTATLPAATATLAGVLTSAMYADLAAAYKAGGGVPVAVADGGTGGATAAAARTAFNVTQAPFAGTLAQILALTASAHTGRLAFATDIAGEPAYRSSGTAWVRLVQDPPGTIASAELLAGFSFRASGTTWTNAGLQINVGTVQAEAYVVEFTGNLGVTWTAALAAGVQVGTLLRIIDSASTKLGDWGEWRARAEGTASSFGPKVLLRFRVPAGHAATIWQLQGKTNLAQVAANTDNGINAGARFPAVVAGAQPGVPALLTATSVA